MSSRLQIWSLSALVLVLGLAATLGLADAQAHHRRSQMQSELVTSSTSIVATMKLAIQHDQDLAVSLGGYLTDASPTNAQFAQWTAAVEAFDRYPELQGLGEIVMVPSSAVSSFEAAQEADASSSMSPEVAMSPSAGEAFQCLQGVSEDRSDLLGLPNGTNLCAGPTGSALLAARTSGAAVYAPENAYTIGLLTITQPIYSTGVLPPTADGRLQAFMGWAHVTVVPSVILGTALRGHPDMSVTLTYANGALHVPYFAGTVPDQSGAVATQLFGNWHVDVMGPVSSGNWWSDSGVNGLLVAGALVSLLLAIVALVGGMALRHSAVLKRKRLADLKYQAEHDTLTGLPNRELVMVRIEEMMTRSRRGEIRMAALFLDLDNFKVINDTMGHAAGDALLIEVGRRLSSVFRLQDTVGRLGGDEFVVLVEQDPMEFHPEGLAQRILELLSEPFLLPTSPLPLEVHASVGIAQGHREKAGQLLHDADVALYRAKDAGKGCAVLFTDEMQAEIDAARQFEHDLTGALEAEQFFLVYQPTVDLATGLVCGAEALLRWRHPLLGVVPPDRFIPVLEQIGMIVPVGRWVLEQACNQAAEWRSAGRDLSMAVNVSAMQLERDDIVDDVRRMLERSGLPAERLVLELTESAVMSDITLGLIRLEQLKTLGLSLAIDDFGTGFASLSYLHRLPIDILKIDRSFVTEMMTSSNSAAIVHTLMELSRALDLRTVAEGVETTEQWEWLREDGCEIGQGYLFARPLSPEAFGALLDLRAEPLGRRVVEVA